MSDVGENLTNMRPGLPTEETFAYRQTFGHLDYMWRISPGERFWRDTNRTIPLFDNELMAVCRFNLHPYISDEFYWSVH